MTLSQNPMLLFISVFLFLGAASCLWAVVADDDVQVQGNYLDWTFTPDEGGALTTLHILGTADNLAGQAGLLQEGFGVGSYYLPNRRLNERLEIVDPDSKRPMLRYQYDCDGPNIKGLQVTRTMEPIIDEMSMRITWTIENKGDESQWISPWVRNEARESAANRLRIPTLNGLQDIVQEGYYPASRNWMAVTETQKKDSVCAIFHADHTHAFLTICDDMEKPQGVQTAYVPRLLKPGEVWTTMYRLNVVRGLDHIDFADDNVAVQLDYNSGAFSALITATKPMQNVHIEARIVAENKQLWKLPRKRFDISPSKLARCTWDWQPPGDGVYEFMAQLYYGDQPIALGKDTGSPHGGIDTFFSVGKPKPRLMEAWTDAPYLLDRGSRVSKGKVAVAGKTTLWFASSLEKVFRQDSILPEGAPDPVIRLDMAGNEYESFQICLRTCRRTIRYRAGNEDLLTGIAAKISASDIAVYNAIPRDTHPQPLRNQRAGFLIPPP